MENCFECGNPATENHLVIPKSMGGTKTVPLCSSCHMKIHGLDNTRRAESHVENTKRGLHVKKDLIEKQGYFISKTTGRRVEKLGNPSFDEEKRWLGNRKSAQVRAERTMTNPSFVEAYKIAKLLRDKDMKNEMIADKLNEMGLRTSRGFLFIPASIPQLIRQGNKYFKQSSKGL